MTAITYPVGLPCPQSLRRMPFERRQVSSSSRPRDARVLQFDRGSTEALTWPPLTTAQLEVLMTWWRETLIFGGSWFAATWPSPQGRVAVVRKFTEQPRRSFIAGGFWRVTATVETRGVGEIPVEPLPPADPEVWALPDFGTLIGGTAATPYEGAAMLLAGGEEAWAGSGADTGVVEEIQVDAVILTGGPWVSTVGSLLYVTIRRINGTAYQPVGYRSA